MKKVTQKTSLTEPLPPRLSKTTKKDHIYAFDAILGPDKTQEELYDSSSRKIVDSFMDGYNSTIFAYGQSGSGKTFSMLGPEEVTEVLVNQNEIPESIQELFGIIPRSTFHIFDLVEQGVKKSTQFTIKVSYIEIYNEAINDILTSPPNTNLKIREFVGQGMSVIGLFERCITTPEEVFDAISIATANRITCATGQNARSSRSHTVFIISVDQTLADGSSKSSRLNLVDLAGSEKLSKTGATGQALKEAQKINLSLTTLGRCIKALTSKNETHVPYRESKLTQILKESLGGNAKTALVCTGSMRKVHFEETVGTLKFAERAKMVKNSAKSNVKRSAEELEALVEQLKLEIERLKKMLIDKDSGTEVLLQGDMSVEYQELKIKYETLSVASQKQIELLQHQVEMAEEKETHGGDMLSLRDEVDSYKDRVDEANEQVNKLTSQNEQQRNHYEEIIENLKKENHENQGKIIQLSEENNSMARKITNLKSDLSTQEEKSIEVTQERDRLLAQENLIKDKINNAENNLQAEIEKRSQADNENEKLKNQIKILIEEKAAIEGKYRETEKNNEDLHKRLFEIEDKEDEYINQIEKLQKENENLKKQLNDAKNQINKLQASLKESIDNSNREKEAIRSENFSLQAEVKQSVAEIQSLRSLLNQNISDKALIQERENYIQEMNSHFQESLNRAKEEKQALGAQLKTFMAQIDSARKNEEIKAEEKEKLAAQLKTVNEKYNKIVKELVEEKQSKAKINARLKELEISQEENKAVLEQAEKAKVEFTENFEKISQENSQLKQSVTVLNETLTKIKEEQIVQYQQLLEEKTKIKQECLNTEKQLREEVEEFENKLNIALSDKKRISSLFEEKNNELVATKSKQLVLESELNRAKVQIETLESDIKQKDREVQIERRTSIIRQGEKRGSIMMGGFQRRQSILNTKITPSTIMKTTPVGPAGFGGVVLRKTDNKFLKDAIQEAKFAAQNAPKSQFQVYYGFDEIRALLYSSVDEEILEEKRERSSSSDSNSSSNSSFSSNSEKEESEEN